MEGGNMDECNQLFCYPIKCHYLFLLQAQDCHLWQMHWMAATLHVQYLVTGTMAQEAGKSDASKLS